jgi:hypothetical protein
MTEGQGELRFDSETQTRNEQNQVRASLERLCSGWRSGRPTIMPTR